MKKGANYTRKVMRICNEEDTDGRVRVTADEDRDLHVD